MKIDQLLVQHFYNSKKLTLQGIGTFLLNYNVDADLATDKAIEIPDGAIEFNYDTKTGEDDDLIKFIVEKTRKIRPLAAADLDSFLVLGKQFLNIGKPFRLEGIGTLLKGQNGNYEFRPGVFVAPRLDATPTAIKEKLYDEVSFNAEAKPTGVSRKGLLLAGVLALFLAAAGGAWWYFYKNHDDNQVAVTNSDTKKVDATKNNADTNAIKKIDTIKANIPMVDGYTFKVVYREASLAEAEKSKAKLKSYGHDNIITMPKDSATVYMAAGFKRPLTDTAAVLDSVRKYFATPKAYIKL